MMRRGWCPSLHEPMASGDGLLVRVKPPGARLSAEDARFLADAACAHGNGMIDLTSRANLQFRGLTVDSARDFAGAVTARGLACADAAAERRRNVLVSPLAGIDPAIDPATSWLAEAVAKMLADDLADALPAKFGCVVDGGGWLPVADAPGDILLQPRGGLVRIALDGDDLAAAVPEAGAVAAVRRLANAFLAMGGARMRTLPAAAVFAAAGLAPDTRRLPAGTRPAVGPLPGAFGYGLPFGQMPAAVLRALAGLADEIRIGPWRGVMLPGGDGAAVDGAITDPDDPALAMSACPGMPACPSATVATRADALFLARSGATAGRRVHVSGCIKGCAHPGPATLTLTGQLGRYRLVRDGRADAPGRFPLTIAEAAAIMAAP